MSEKLHLFFWHTLLLVHLSQCVTNALTKKDLTVCLSLERFTLFKCLTTAECFIDVLCLKSSVDICEFSALIHKKLHHHTVSMHSLILLYAILNSCLWIGPRYVRHISPKWHTSHLLTRHVRPISPMGHTSHLLTRHVHHISPIGYTSHLLMQHVSHISPIEHTSHLLMQHVRHPSVIV